MGASVSKTSVKFFIDKEKNRVVFAEVGKDFLDILFSFLTLPMSTVIELISDSSVLESMTNVHKSVKSLDDKHLETKACKDMLLHPLSAGAFRCENLKINIGNTNPRRFYHCYKYGCTNNRDKIFISLVPDVQCSYCEKSMDSTNSWQKRKEDSVLDDGGVFVKGGETTFIIMDDLSVMPASVASTSTLLQKLGIRSNKKLEERILDLGKEEVSHLLKQSIISGTPLNDICFHKTEVIHNESRTADTRKKMSVKTEGRLEAEHCEQISIKLYIDKDHNRIFCAEVDGEMMNLVFSFLVLPIGSVIKLLNDASSMGCLDNLYRSVEGGLGSEYIVSDECKSLLLSPKLPPFFSCSKNLLNVEEMLPHEGSSCDICFSSVSINGRYVHPQLVHLNPKKKENKTEKGGGYANGRAKYILTDNLCVSPLTPTGILQAISDCEGTFSKILEREVVVGKVQALELLKAALISKSPLTDVFLPQAGGRRMHYIDQLD